MQELWAFVEESCIVFIALKDEVLALSQLKAAAKVFCNPADQERRLQPGTVKNPSQHGRRGSLAVRARDHQHFFPAQKLLVKNLWQRTEGDALIEHLFQFHITARDGIADNHQVRRWLQILHGKWLG